MKKTYILIMMSFLTAMILLSPPKVLAQKKGVTIESVVKDENGNPVAGAIIYGNEGTVISRTDAEGAFTITVPSNQMDLFIESDGFESALFRTGDPLVLKSARFQYGDKDVVNIAFGKVKQGDLVNAVSVLDADEVLRYDNNQNTLSAIAGRVPGLIGSSNLRGLGAALFIVDGLPRDINTISLAEIEQITFLKDINSAILYGNQAVNGVVLIRTKRGQAHKKEVKVTGYYGMSTPAALPNYLSSAEYAELYNEARINDGLAPQYDAEQIAGYRSGNPYLYPSIDYYSDEYLNGTRPFFKVLTELSGGNDAARYYTNLGWDQSGSLLNFGEGQNAKRNIFNVRGNVDISVNHWITTALDAAFVLNSNKGPVGNYWADAATRQPNLVAPLIPIDLVNPSDPLLAARKNDVNGRYLIGGNQSNLRNPFADGYSGGSDELIQRTFSFNNRIDFDLNELAAIEGLAFHTNVSFDLYTRYNQSVNNTYSVYEAAKWSADGTRIDSLAKYGEDTRPGTQNIGNEYFERKVGFYGMLDYDRTFDALHHVSASLLGFAARQKQEGIFQPDKNANLGLRVAYGYNNRYLLDFSSAYVASAKLPEGNRGAFSPSLGLAWVLSEEDFMSGASAVDHLKLRVSAGVMNSDAGIGGYYYYDNVYSFSGGYSWYEGNWSNNGVVSSYSGNSGLFFEKRKEVNVGFEGMFFNRMLSVDANVFTSVYSDQITRPQTQYPSYYVNFMPYENFGRNAYRGAELGLSFSRQIGKIAFTIGGNALYATSEVLKRDEIYLNEYRNRTGHSLDTRFGLEAAGLFMDQAEIDNHAIQAFGKVKPGDIKYVDQNNDGVVDDNDEVAIGRSQSPLTYGLNLKVAYGNFTLFALGRGNKGADGAFAGDYYWVDGDDKYSDVVLGRWTEATKATATYPRLSSLASPNNFRNSTYWLFNANSFNLARVQLTYDMPERVAQMLRMKHLNLYVDGSNLFTISEIRERADLRFGAEPSYRSFSLGARITF
jgi:TonB-linked SusC/RagA family outer membrane protein